MRKAPAPNLAAKRRQQHVESNRAQTCEHETEKHTFVLNRINEFRLCGNSVLMLHDLNIAHELYSISFDFWHKLHNSSKQILYQNSIKI